MGNTIIASIFKEITHKRRYLMNTVFSVAMFYVIFLALLGGARLFLGAFNYGDTLLGLVVGFYSWTMMLAVFTSNGYIVEDNKLYGTIETITANSTGLTLVLITEAAVSIVFYFVFSIFNLFLYSVTARVPIAYNIISILVIMLIGLSSVFGVSLLVAGITLLIRKASNILSILQFALLGFLLLPPSMTVKITVPFSCASTLLRTIMLKDETILELPFSDLLYLLINAIIYLSLGIAAFQLCFTYARKKGVLGYY